MVTHGLKWTVDKATQKYANDITEYLKMLDKQTEQLMENNIILLEQWRKEHDKLWNGEK